MVGLPCSSVDQLAGWCLLNLVARGAHRQRGNQCRDAGSPTLLPLRAGRRPYYCLARRPLADADRRASGHGRRSRHSMWRLACWLPSLGGQLDYHGNSPSLTGTASAIWRTRCGASDESADLVQVASSSDTSPRPTTSSCALPPANRQREWSTSRWPIWSRPGPAARFFVLPPDGARAGGRPHHLSTGRPQPGTRSARQPACDS